VESINQRLDRLIRQGMMPARQLPILHRALASIKMGKVLTPYERQALRQLLDSMMGFQFGDDITYNRARLHTQKTKYQTEETGVISEEDVIIYDGNKDEQEAKRDKKVKKKASGKKLKDTNGLGQSNAEEEDMKEEHARGANRPADKHEGDKESPKQGGSVVPEITDGPKQSGKPDVEETKGTDKRPKLGEGLIDKKFKRRKRDLSDLPKSLRKEKEKSSVRESEITKDILAFNAAYKEHLNKSLEDKGVENIRDIPQEEKKEFFNDLDETITKKHLKMAKGIAFDKRYKGGNYSGAAKAMEKVKKGLSDHPEAQKHLKHANEELEHPLEEGRLKDYALGHGYFDDSSEGRAKRKDPNWLSKQAASKKTISYAKKKKVVKEQDLTELSPKTLKSYKKAKQERIGNANVQWPKDTKNLERAEKKLKLKESELEEGGIGGAVKLKDASKAVKSMEKSMGLKVKSSQRFVSKNKDGKVTGYGGKTTYTREETETDGEEENPLPKTPNQAIRDVHKTVRDVLSPDPLVIDPNVELQKETDRLYNDVQEGAKQDALRDIKQDSGRGMAPVKKDPKPGKSKHDGSENKGPEHIVAQMRKAVSLGDKHDGVKFKDGKTHKVSSAHAHKFLDRYMKHKPADKLKMQDHAHASHDNFKKHVE